MGGIQGELPRIKSIIAKQRRGETLTDAETRQLEGHQAVEKIKKRPFNKGSYVKFELDRGIILATVVGNDDQGNYLVEYASQSQAVIRKSTIVNAYLIRESSLIGLDEYVMGTPPYERIVDKEGFILRFYDNKLEAKRVKREHIDIPEDQRLRPNDDWGMIVR